MLLMSSCRNNKPTRPHHTVRFHSSSVKSTIVNFLETYKDTWIDMNPLSEDLNRVRLDCRNGHVLLQKDPETKCAVSLSMYCWELRETMEVIAFVVG